MTISAIASLAQLEATLKTDLIQTVGTPVLTFLQSTQTIAENLAASPTPSAAQIATATAQESAAWVTFTAGVIGGLPELGAEAIVALTQFCVGKVQTALSGSSAAVAVSTAKPA